MPNVSIDVHTVHALVTNRTSETSWRISYRLRATETLRREISQYISVSASQPITCHVTGHVQRITCHVTDREQCSVCHVTDRAGAAET